MAATARAFHSPGWVYEEKIDGWRVLAYKDAAGVRLVSRNARDLTRRFPELAAAVGALEPPTLLPTARSRPSTVVSCRASSGSAVARRTSPPRRRR